MIDVDKVDVIGADEPGEMITQCTVVRVLEGQPNETEEKRGVASTVAIDVLVDSRVAGTIFIGETIAILVMK